jgi:hypothetical protein
MMSPFDFKKFPWMRFALQEIGEAEVPGKNVNNPRILQYQATARNGPDEEIAWCSAFANWCMTLGGQRGTGCPTLARGSRGATLCR